MGAARKIVTVSGLGLMTGAVSAYSFIQSFDSTFDDQAKFAYTGLSAMLPGLFFGIAVALYFFVHTQMKDVWQRVFQCVGTLVLCTMCYFVAVNMTLKILVSSVIFAASVAGFVSSGLMMLGLQRLYKLYSTKQLWAVIMLGALLSGALINILFLGGAGTGATSLFFILWQGPMLVAVSWPLWQTKK